MDHDNQLESVSIKLWRLITSWTDFEPSHIRCCSVKCVWGKPPLKIHLSCGNLEMTGETGEQALQNLGLHRGRNK